MKLPREHRAVLTFKHKDDWYKIIYHKDRYELYKVIDMDKDFELIATGNNPKKLEDKVYSGKLKEVISV